MNVCRMAASSSTASSASPSKPKYDATPSDAAAAAHFESFLKEQGATPMPKSQPVDMYVPILISLFHSLFVTFMVYMYDIVMQKQHRVDSLVY
jgi:hypothetical protein